MTGPEPPIWVFDVDGCLVDSQTATDLRPGAADLLTTLRDIGARVLVWSAGGASYAAGRLRLAGVDHLVDAFLGKDRRGADGRYVWEAGLEPGLVFVDDRPEDLPVGADVVAVSPYIAANPHDRALDNVRRRLPAGGAAPPPG